MELYGLILMSFDWYILQQYLTTIKIKEKTVITLGFFSHLGNLKLFQTSVIILYKEGNLGGGAGRFQCGTGLKVA